MKVTFEKISNKDEESAVIRATEKTEQIITAMGLLENGEQILLGTLNGEKVPCPVSKIFYIESVDEKTFMYLENDCLEVQFKLYELEDILDQRFFRCSKSMICNMKKIKSVKVVENSKMRATLVNGETIIISRSYVKELKRRLGL